MIDKTAVETVKTAQDVATGARILTYMKENRVEMVCLLILGHLLGLSDRILGQVSGVCF